MGKIEVYRHNTLVSLVRRRRCWLEAEHKPVVVAANLGQAPRSVCNWIKWWRGGGVAVILGGEKSGPQRKCAPAVLNTTVAVASQFALALDESKRHKREQRQQVFSKVVVCLVADHYLRHVHTNSRYTCAAPLAILRRFWTRSSRSGTSRRTILRICWDSTGTSFCKLGKDGAKFEVSGSRHWVAPALLQPEVLDHRQATSARPACWRVVHQPVAAAIWNLPLRFFPWAGSGVRCCNRHTTTREIYLRVPVTKP